MLNFTETAIRLYRQFFSTPDAGGLLADDIETVLDGNTAIAVTEACFTEVAALGSGFIEQGAALAWLSEQQRISKNLFDEKLTVLQADSARGALASAIGVTMSGHRSSVFLNAQNIAGCQDLLQLAAGRRLPLVIHLENRLFAKHDNSSGSGHEALHQVLDSGIIVLFAANVQQAVDFTLIARHIAEITMTPAIVVIDGNETALAAQNVRLPGAELIKGFIGRADEKIKSPSVAQKQLFSGQRSRLHRWFDLDKPVLHGMLQDPEIFAMGSAAASIYFDDLIEKTLHNAFTLYAKLSGRKYSTLSTHAIEKADIIIIAQGSAIETVKTLSDILANQKLKTDRIKVGVIGVHCLRPFNATQLINLLTNNKNTTKQVVVLERMHVPLADDAPLMREIRAAIQKKNLSKGLPDLHSIIYGLGGSCLNIADLWQVCRQVKNHCLQGRYLGIAFNIEGRSSKYPKRQVLSDTLVRYYPQLSKLGIKAGTEKLPLFADKSYKQKAQHRHLGFAISQLAGEDADRAYAMELAEFLHKLSGGYLRSFISPSWQQWSVSQIDYVTQSDKAVDTGCSALVNFFIVLSTDIKSILSACQGLNQNGQLLFTDYGQFDKLTHSSEARQDWENCLALIKSKNLDLYRINATVSEYTKDTDVQNTDLQIREKEPAVQEIQWEKILGTIVGKLQSDNKLNIKTRKIISIRQSFLNHYAETNQNMLAVLFRQAMENTDIFDYKSVTIDNQSQTPGKAQQSIIIKPAMIENFARAGDELISNTYDSLPRFQDQTGVLAQAGELQQLTADPYLATGTIPPLTASFNDLTRQGRCLDIPVFEAQNCTACGVCWVNCPDSAIATVALTPGALIETAIKITAADALRQVTSRLASRIARHLRSIVNNDTIEITNAGNLLIDAFDWLKEKSDLPEKRLKVIQTDFEKAFPAIANLPISVTEVLFTSQENRENGSGELFSLLINPQTCKACGLCVELCQTNALIHLSDSSEDNSMAESVSSYKQLWAIWQQTADTQSATIERLIREQSLDSGAALMLSRHNAFALSGGDFGEPAAGEKIAMRQLLSAVEYHQQPLLFRFIIELEKIKDELNEEISQCLSQALPTDNLTLLAKKLSDIKTRQIDLNSLLETHTQVIQNTSIDVVKVRVLVEYVLQINELHWKLSQGTYGLGRARYSLCITSSSITSWAGSFPNNPFHVPVYIDVTGESAQIAAGIVQGQIKDILSVMSLKRKAKASVNASYAKKTKILEQLHWNDLTFEEKQLCPPLLLVGGDDLLAGQGFSQVSLLLNSSYPVKIVVFSELDCGLANQGLHEHKLHHRYDSRNNLAMMAMSQRNAYVAQTSIANNSHLQQCVDELLSYTAAGLIRIHTPSPSAHGFKPEFCLRQAQLAVTTRIYPLFSYSPQREGVFGSRISLQGNIDITQDWVNDKDNKPQTPVDWAILESRFQAHFSPLPATVSLISELSDWLNLPATEQKKNTPYVILEQGEKIAISHEFAKIIQNRQQTWRTLLELAGIVTPFTDYIEKCVEQRLESEHQAELENLRIEYEAKLAHLEENYNNRTHTKIRNQLLGLAGYNASNLD